VIHVNLIASIESFQLRRYAAMTVGYAMISKEWSDSDRQNCTPYSAVLSEFHKKGSALKHDGAKQRE
jgi:hypothetical protein